MNSVTSRHRAAPRRPRAQGAATTAALCAAWALFVLSAPALAQGTDGLIPPPDAPRAPGQLAPPPPESPGDAAPANDMAEHAAPERDDGQTKAERLDDLFAELAGLGEEEEGARKRVAGEIGRLWSHSGSDSMDLLLRRGRQAMEDGDNHRALAHFSALTDHAPNFPEGWNARATAYFLLEEWGQALADIERTLALEPRHFGALTGLAVILEKIDRPADALRAWRRALAVHPHLERAVKAEKRLAEEVEGRGI